MQIASAVRYKSNISLLSALFRRVWDVTDFVVPPTENAAFFVTTNAILTPNQTQGRCPEDPTVAGARECDPKRPGMRKSKNQKNVYSICQTNFAEETCPRGSSLPLGHGVNTGRCVPSDSFYQQNPAPLVVGNGTSGPGLLVWHSCEILAWCPVEKDRKPLGEKRAMLEAAENFTVLIKNQVCRRGLFPLNKCGNIILPLLFLLLFSY